MITTIRLRGVFGQIHQKSIRLDVSSAGEAISALCTMIPEFKKILSISNFILIKDGNKSIKSNEISIPSEFKTLDFVPSVSGQKVNVSVLEILAGAAIIGALFIPGVAPFLGIFAYSVAGLGASLVAGGITSLIMHQSTPKSQDPNASTNLSVPNNIATDGVPVPLAYGTYLVGSNTVSASLSTTS